MKLYTSLPKALQPYYHLELEKLKVECTNNNLKKAWHHLECTQIIRQNTLRFLLMYIGK